MAADQPAVDLAEMPALARLTLEHAGPILPSTGGGRHPPFVAPRLQ